uniref:L-type lectin-domain containing receptor kinase IX.1-like n=1 Tax=Erigeron canadensis TaxID=72917 RepID=UPI001CB99BBE|nr:L-type lectin-domain containing receptor kinase IX.1-like [Erigeron canadensis]
MSIHMIIIYLVIVSIPCAISISFNLTNIGPQNLNREIEVNGSYVSDGGIQVTPNEIGSDRSDKAGQAIYFRQLRLWDSSTRELVSFSTNFTFVIDSNGNTSYADGLTFFLAEKNSVITKGGSMGLPIDPIALNATNRFVAVEFDTFYNTGWDPSPHDHVGISISSLNSSRTERWFSNITGGRECEAWITYDSVSKNLSVSFTGYQNNRVVRQDGLFYTVDLRNELPESVIFGFSAATGLLFQKNNVISWSFNSSGIHNVDPVKGKNSKVGLVIGLVVGVAFAGLFLYVLWRWKKKSSEDEAQDVGFDVEMNNEFEIGTGPKRFSYNELARSTSYFSESDKLGEGGFGGVYKGFLKDLSTYVAVKKVSKSSKQGIKEYASEVKIISRLRHRNLVQLIGWCHEKSELLLVYEYMENGSLDSHLFKARSLLPWDTRYKIAHGVASALLYLHEEWEQCVLHRDIKSSNVMLDTNFNAKLGDFGLAKLVDHEKGSQTTMIAGTFGYMAPECVVTGKASKESDVFSFGVVALEIACGQKPIEYKAEEKQIRLVARVWELYGLGTLLEAADPCLGSEFDVDEIQRLMIVGLWCAHPDSESRPSMRQAIQVLDSEAPLPLLPIKMPVASYLSPQMSSLYGVTSIIKMQSSSSNSNTESSMNTMSSSSSPSVSLLHSMG